MFREASHLNGFSGNALARLGEAGRPRSVADALASEGASVHLFAEDRALVRVVGEKLSARFTQAEAQSLGLDPDSLIVLGADGQALRLAGLATAPEKQTGIEAVDLRSLAIQGALDPADLAALAQARSTLHWHAQNRYCGRCGDALALNGGGVSRGCAACGTEIFPRIDPVVIMLAIDGDRCLLGRQARFAPGMYSALAGFMEPGETIEEAVRREVKEESGIEIGRVAYYSSQAWPFPSSLMIGCHAEALSTEITYDAAELEDCRWFDREEARLMLAHRHSVGLKTPFKMAIAHHLIASFAD
jgi:NAD+ diphosphatase